MISCLIVKKRKHGPHNTTIKWVKTYIKKFSYSITAILYEYLKVNGSTAFFWSSIVVRVGVAMGESAMTPACYALCGQQVSEKNQVTTVTDPTASPKLYVGSGS